MHNYQEIFKLQLESQVPMTEELMEARITRLKEVLKDVVPEESELEERAKQHREHLESHIGQKQVVYLKRDYTRIDGAVDVKLLAVFDGDFNTLDELTFVPELSYRTDTKDIPEFEIR